MGAFIVSASATLIDVTGVQFNQVLSEMTALAPAMLPVVVSCIAFRKGIGFIKSMIKGA